MNNLKYDFEINEHSPRAEQPHKIKTKLKAHQLACLYKAMHMEQNGNIDYETSKKITVGMKDINKISVKTNIGILGDIVGYGKTITALSIIANSDINKIHINNTMSVSVCNPYNYSYLSYTTDNQNIIRNDNIINSTLVIVPRGPVYVQWEKTLKENTTLKYLCIENLKFIKNKLPESKSSLQDIKKYFESYDVVLIKNTTLESFISQYSSILCHDNIEKIPFIKRWKRIMIDEIHDLCNCIPLMYYDYLWLISGTHESLLYSIRSYKSILFHMKDSLSYETINLILVKGSRDFVRNSFKIPLPNEKIYVCRMHSRMNIIKNFVCASILEKINANDIYGAIKDLGGKADTQTNVVELVSNDLMREISNKERERDYIESLDISIENKTLRIKTIDFDIAMKKDKLKNLQDRINEINSKSCSICMYDIEHPIMLECTHSYCAACIIQWLNKNINCPECRHVIDTEKMISIMNDKDIHKLKNEKKSKLDTLIDIIKNKPEGRYLVFSQFDSGFGEIARTMSNNDIVSSELKGNTSHMMNVLNKFKSGEINVILLNTNFAGSGIDISIATDVIIFHSMGLAKHQAIGRAQRIGRTDILNIHYLCYEHEINNI